MFLLVGLGMACGVGLLEVAGLGTAFLCLILVVLDRFGEEKSRRMVLSVAAIGQVFPSEHVDRVLGANVDFFEAREMVQIAIRPGLPDQGEDRLRAYGYRRIYHRFGAT